MIFLRRNDIFKLFFITIISFIFVSCSGGGGGGSNAPSEMVTISGIAIKGIIVGAKVSAYQVTKSGQKGQLLGTADKLTDEQGKYSIAIPVTSGPIVVEVSGQPKSYYESESTGQKVFFGETESFRAIIPNAMTPQVVTISPLTEAAYLKALQLLIDSPTTGIVLDTAISRGNNAVADLHKIINITAAPDDNYKAALTIIDEIIQSTPNANTKTITTMLVNAITSNDSAQTTGYTTAVTNAANNLKDLNDLGILNLTYAKSFETIKQSIQNTYPVLPIEPPTKPIEAPTGFTTSLNDNSITLSWNQYPGDVTYYLYRNGIYLTATKDLTSTDSSISPSTKYTYEVKAQLATGGFSEPVLFQITTEATTNINPVSQIPFDITPPTVPHIKTVKASVGTSGIVLEWDPSSPGPGSIVAISGYKLYRSTSYTFAEATLIESPKTPLYTDTTVVPDTTYYYWVRAINANEKVSAISDFVKITTAQKSLPTPINVTVGGQVTVISFDIPITYHTDIIAPTAPSILTASTSNVTATTSSVLLSWSAATDNSNVIAGYEVYRDGFKIATVALLGYTDLSVSSDTTYNYSVVAFDAAGNRSLSSSLFPVKPNTVSLGVTVGGQIASGLSGLNQNDITSPSAPSNLTASTANVSTTTSSVLLSWSGATDNKGVTGYDVYRDGSKIATVSLLGYTDLSVSSNTTYSYSVVAFDGAGNRSLSSNQLAVTPNKASLGVTFSGQIATGLSGLNQTDITSPSAPYNLTASTTNVSANTSSVLISWSAATDNKAVTGYDVYRNGTKIATVALLGYTDPTVGSNTTYIYSVVAFDAAGNRSFASNQLSVTPNMVSLGVTVGGQIASGLSELNQTDVTPPSAPLNLTASTSNVSTTTSSVLLAWSASTDNKGITGYDVYRNGTKIASVTLLGYTDLSVTSSTTYSYYVVAFDAAGNRSLSNNQLAVTPNTPSLGVTVGGQVASGFSEQNQTDTTSPSAPYNLSASTSNVSSATSSVLLSWSAATDNKAVTGYDVYRNGSKIATVTLLGYTDLSVSSNTTYSYSVVAFDAAGNRSFSSNQLTVTPNTASLGVTVGGQVANGLSEQSQTDITSPSAPSNLTASTANVSSTTSSVLLSWSAATDNRGVTGYDVYRNGSKITTVSQLGYTDLSVNSNTTYNYTVVAFDAAGNRSYSGNQLAVTPNTASLGVTVAGQIATGLSGLNQTDITSPSSPYNLTASTANVSATTSSVLLSWNAATDNKGVTGYDVYRNDSKIATVSQLGYTDLSVSSNTTYIYSVVAFDAAGNRSFSSNQLAVTPNTASLGVTVGGQVASGLSWLNQTDTTPPSAPYNLSASTTNVSTTTSSVLLSWSAATDNKGVTGYDVYRNGSKIATVVLLGYTDPTVSSTQTYSYTVVAFDAAGNRSVSSNQLVVTPNTASLGVTVGGQLASGLSGLNQTDITSPSAPYNLTASTANVSTTTSSVLLSWSAATDNKGVAGYDVYRNGSKIATVSQLGYTDLSVSSNTTYNYSVVAFDAAGNRSFSSNQLAVTPNTASLGVSVGGQIAAGLSGLNQTDITSPSAPYNLSASTANVSTTTSSVLLSWSAATDNKGVTGYDVYRNGVKVATVVLLGYTDLSVGSNTTYNYSVIAFDAAGNRSLSSNQLAVAPNTASLGVTVGGQIAAGLSDQNQVDVSPPSAPSYLSASTTNVSTTTSSVLLSWSASTDNKGVAGYDIYRDNLKIDTVTATNYTDFSRVNSVIYKYYVVAFDAAGNRSLAGNQIQVTPPPPSLGITVSGQIFSAILGF